MDNDFARNYLIFNTGMTLEEIEEKISIFEASDLVKWHIEAEREKKEAEYKNIANIILSAVYAANASVKTGKTTPYNKHQRSIEKMFGDKKDEADRVDAENIMKEIFG